MDYTEIPFEEGAAKAKIAAEAALAIDPTLVEAATAMIYSTDDIEQQIKLGKQAIDMNPSFATTHQWYATTIALVGDLETAVEEYLKALELDPRSRVINENLAVVYGRMGDWKSATRVLEQMLSWAPDYTSGIGNLFLLKIATGDRVGAELIGQQLVTALKRNENKLDVYLDLAFEPTKRAGAIQELLSWPQHDWWSPENPRLLDKDDLLEVFARLGELDQARSILSELIENRPSYGYGSYRIDRSIPEFVCDSEARKMLAATDLPPLRVPYPCEELLR
jgi:tetratricopeptide (TPR) repeat protein